MSTTDRKFARKRKKPWWKIQEEVSFLFEKLFRPLEREILHDTRQRDIVGVLRQLDVGVINSGSVQSPVKALVEVQKRKSKVGIEEFGSWIYKRSTLRADELIIVSREGFTRAVVAHAKRENVRLGMLREVDTGYIKDIDSTFLGTTRVWNKWWFASIFVQYEDSDEIDVIEPQPDYETKIFGPASPMDLIRMVEKNQGNRPSGQMLTFRVKGNGKLSYRERPLKVVMITAEKQRRIWNPKAHFFAYDEVYPNRAARGIAMVSEFRWDDARSGTLILVISPDIDHVTGERDARIAGQFEFT